MTKIIIIHPNVYDVKQNDVLMDSLNSDVISIKCDESMTKEDVLAKISASEVTHLAFMYHFPGYESLPFFVNPNIPEPVEAVPLNGTPSEMTELMTSTSSKSDKYLFYNDNVISFINSIKSLCPSQLIVDILSCSLSMPEYKTEVLQIESDLNIDIRYSTDLTGNPAEGANWVMESELPSIVNVRSIYFTDNVLTWTGVLNNNITAAIKAGGLFVPYISWNASTKTFTLLQNIVWTSFVTATGINVTDFIAVNSTEIFDGNNKTIDLTGVSNWKGLFLSTGTDLINLPRFIKLGTINGTSLATNAGYIMRQDCRRFQVEDCYNTGLVNGIYSGGIAGYRAGYIGSAGIGKIYRSYNTGTITAAYGGGIAGFSVANSSGILIVEDCYNTGAVNGTESGGIIGTRAAEVNGNITITNCYNTGNITTNGSAGICSVYAGFNGGRATITNCYNTGSLTGRYAGGIIGYAAGTTSGTVTIDNCYNTGTFVGLDVGGIAGHKSGELSGTVTITKCYNSADINTPYSGGICGSVIAYNNGRVTVENCYNTGIVGTFGGGGIIGSQCGDTNGVVIVRNSFNTGNITQNGCGGIIGNFAGNVGGTITLSKCYNIGNFVFNAALHAGGLTGAFTGANNGTVTIEDSYNAGAISSFYCGGICGSDTATSSITGNTSTVTIRRCYSSGIKHSTAGSVAGYNVRSSPNGTLTIVDCVVNGALTGANSGSGITVTNTSISIADISGAIVAAWPTATWATGSSVTISGTNYALPILKVFQLSPWLSTSSSSVYYDTANTRPYYYVAVTEVTVSGSTTNVNTGYTISFSASALPSNATDLTVTWSSLHGSIATVNSSGTVSGISSGNATIRATSLITPEVYDDINITVSQSIAVQNITVSAASLSINVGSTTALSAFVIPSFATDKSLTWSSLHQSIATVDSSTGTIIVTGVTPGLATIRATSVSTPDIFDDIEITVLIPVTNITVNSSILYVGVDLDITLSTSVLPLNASNTSVTWSSLHESFATVDSNGTVTGVTQGTATIRATSVSNPDIFDDIEITIVIPVTNITVSAGIQTAMIGYTNNTLSTAILPLNATNTSVTWSSLHPLIATVNSLTGTVNGISAGIATIRATSVTNPNVFDDIQITVFARIPVTNISSITMIGGLNSNSLYVGSTATLSATAEPQDATFPTITWSSAEPDTLSIDQDTGVMNAVAISTSGVIITASSNNTDNKSRTVRIYVLPVPVTSLDPLTTEGSVTRLSANTTLQFTTTANPSTASNKTINWSVTNNDTTISSPLATIDSNGLLSAASNVNGRVNIVARSASNTNVSQSYTLFIFTGPTGVTITNNNSNITTLGTDSYQILNKVFTTNQPIFTGTVEPSTTSNKRMIWTSSDETVARISSPLGIITPVGPGTTTIRAASEVDTSIFKEVSLTIAGLSVTSITVSAAPTLFYVTSQATLSATVVPSNAVNTSVIWSSSSANVTVDENTGVITGMIAGSATITATAADNSGTTGTALVTVADIPVNRMGTVQITDLNGVPLASQTTLKVGDEAQLIVELLAPSNTTPPNNWSPTVTWSTNSFISSSNPTITYDLNTNKYYAKCTINALQIYAIGLNMTATSNGVIARRQIVVLAVPVTGLNDITTTNNIRRIAINSQLQLSTSVIPINASEQTITWSVNNNLATINSSGLLTAGTTAGLLTVTASASGINKTYDVSIFIPVASITVTNNNTNITTTGTDTYQILNKVYTASAPVLTTTIAPSDATTKTVNWSSTNTDVATVSYLTNIIVPKSAGTTTLRAFSTENPSIFKEVTLNIVNTPVTSIKLSGAPKGNVMFVSGTAQLTAAVGPNDAANKAITWTSNDDTKATVSSSGLVTGFSAGGPVTITATAQDGSGVSASVDLTINDISIASIGVIGLTTLSGSSIKATVIGINSTVYGKSELKPPANTTPPINWTPTVTWNSSDNTFISISEPSIIYESNKWFAIAKLTGAQNTSTRINITVSPGVGTAKAGKGAYTVSPIRVAKVAISGPIALSTNTQGNVSAEITPNNATFTGVTWSVANDKGIPAEPLATINESGQITVGSNIGTIVVTATSTDPVSAKSATRKITINEPASDITLDSISNTISTGTDDDGFPTYTMANDSNKKAVVKATVFPSTANKSYLLTSTNNNIVLTSSNILTAKNVGTATIRVMSATNNSIYKEFKITVLPAPISSIALKLGVRNALTVNQTTTITPNILPTSAADKTLTWTSSNEAAVIIVNPTEAPYVTDGSVITVRGVAAGRSVITATSNNNIVKTIAVSVV